MIFRAWAGLILFLSPLAGRSAEPWELYYRRGLWFEQRSRHAEALAEYQTAERLNPACPACALRASICLYSMGRKAEALPGLDRHLSRHPEDAKAFAFRSRVAAEASKAGGMAAGLTPSAAPEGRFFVGLLAGVVFVPAVSSNFASPYTLSEAVPGGAKGLAGMELRWRFGRRWVLEGGMQFGPSRAWTVEYYNGVEHNYVFRETAVHLGLGPRFSGPWSILVSPVVDLGYSWLSGELKVKKPASSSNLDLPGSAKDSKLESQTIHGILGLDLERRLVGGLALSLRGGYRFAPFQVDQSKLSADMPFPRAKFEMYHSGPYAALGLRYGF